MALPAWAKANFKTLQAAASDGNLALVEVTEASSGETRYAVCAIGRDKGDYVITPFGHLCPDDPFTFYNPPETKDA